MKLEPYHQYLNTRIEAAKLDWIPAPVLFREILALGYDGGAMLIPKYKFPRYEITLVIELNLIAA